MLRAIIAIVCVMCMAISATVIEDVSYVCWFGFMYLGSEIAISREGK